jgi:hypothetical protein
VREADAMSSGASVARELPVVNSHVHVPPNFSAFTDVDDLIATAVREGARVLGASNFHDVRVYRRFAEGARAAGIVPLFGVEFITVVDALRESGTRVNDPANPGRLYLCGKGVDPFSEPSPEAADLDARARAANRQRAAQMTGLLRACFEQGGVATDLDDMAIAADVAARAGVPVDWVVLQERHLAMAFQSALFAACAPDERAAALDRVYGVPAKSVDDPAAVQGEIRARLMKAGGPAFVDESPLTFAEAYRLILERGGIPCYPTLADGSSPICPFEEGPEELAVRVAELGIHAAELIPVRNAPEVVIAYARAFRSAGIIVTAGTEHNTPDRIPLAPLAKGGAPVPAEAAEIFWEGACAVAGHQAERAAGRAGFVDADGRLDGEPQARIRRYAEIGEAVIERRSVPA